MSAGCHECDAVREADGTPVVLTTKLAQTRALNQPAPAGSVSLTTLKPGQTAMVRHTDLDAGDADLLRAMGLRLSARVRLCRLGEPCIVEVLSGSESCGRKGGCACRIGLARPLADKVLVGSIEG
jgi:hypothetical protein